MRYHTAILGAGTMGTALATAAARGGRSAILWSSSEEVSVCINEAHRHPYHFAHHELPRSLAATGNLRKALSGAKCVIVAVPSEVVRDLAKEIKPHLEPDAIVVSTVKALEQRTNKRMSTVLREETNISDVGAISGPNMSHDIMDSLPTALVVGAERSAVAELVADALEGPSLRVYGTPDLVGLELVGALKNVVAIAAGIAAGLGLGDNARALIITRGLKEIQTLSTALGGCAETVSGLGGIGDLFLTTTSAHSRNHMVGIELGKGEALSQIVLRLRELKETAEGIRTVEACRQLAASHWLTLPLAEAVHDIMFGQSDPRESISRVLQDDSDGFNGCPFPRPAPSRCASDLLTKLR